MVLGDHSAILEGVVVVLEHLGLVFIGRWQEMRSYFLGDLSAEDFQDFKGVLVLAGVAQLVLQQVSCPDCE